MLFAATGVTDRFCDASLTVKFIQQFRNWTVVKAKAKILPGYRLWLMS